MAKAIGKVKVISVDEYKRKDGSIGYRVVAMTDDQNPIVFYRPAEEQPQVGNDYAMVLGFDNRLQAVVRYQKM